VVVEGDLSAVSPLLARLRHAGIELETRSGEGLLRLGHVRLAPGDGRAATKWSQMLDAPVVLFDLALDYASCTRLALAAADQAGEPERAAAAGLFQAAGMAVSFVDDFPGLIVMRTVCMLANEAAEAVHTGVAEADAVDAAMRLGVSYPKGPLAWAEAIGARRVVEVLDHLAQTYGEDRYRASLLLRRKAWAAGRGHD
jgi:3-hydroxybutyryl-CoA dehydrogenase